MNSNSLVTRIDNWLPQTQCGQCGYPRCQDYAIALAHGEANINQCPPGNSITIAGLAELLDLPVTGLDPAFGFHRARALAVIDESLCIGCKLCIEACPVDAIVGTAKYMHTVVSAECTGCELCLPPCPMDCIQLIPWSNSDHKTGRWPDYPAAQVARAQQRVQARSERLAKTKSSKNKNSTATNESSFPDRDTIRREIKQAVVRVRERRKEKREKNKEQRERRK